MPSSLSVHLQRKDRGIISAVPPMLRDGRVSSALILALVQGLLSSSLRLRCRAQDDSDKGPIED